MYSYLFGPVPSRRLGMSLGVDLVPKKVCSLDCVYCEVGETSKLTTSRMAYIPVEKIRNELQHYFEKSPDPDYITFSGSGEPTLNLHIGEILQYIKSEKPAIPVAVLTNGTLLHDPAVRKAIVNADVVLPSLDAATAATFRKINRPANDLEIGEIIQGLSLFRNEYNGKIWLEVFILPGYNDHHEELIALKNAIGLIRPDSVQLNTLDRPGTIERLQPASRSQLSRIRDFLGKENIEIIARPKKRKEQRSFREDIASTILETIARRPCTAEDLSSILGLHVSEVNKYLDVLDGEEKIEAFHQDRGFFYRLK